MNHEKGRSDEQQLTDEELIIQIRNGDGETCNKAWEQLAANLKSLIASMAGKKAGGMGHKEIVEELMQAGWVGFVNAAVNYDEKKAKKSKFSSYAFSYINGEMNRELRNQLNSSGIKLPQKCRRSIRAVPWGELAERTEGAEAIYFDEDEDFDYDAFIENLKMKFRHTGKKRDDSVRAVQILEVLKMVTDEKYTISKTQLAKCLQIYRMAKHQCVEKEEGENTMITAIEKLLQEIDPLEYTGDNDKDYLVKYKGYKENKLLKKINKEKGAGKITITDFSYEHPFSYKELDQIISLIAFTDTLSEQEKLSLIQKVQGTASLFYQTPFVNDYSQKINFKANRIADRFTGERSNTRGDISHNLKVLQEAINCFGQVSFRFQRYNERGELEIITEREYTISPYHIVVYHDQYYCIGHKKNDNRTWHFRIDLMTDVRILKNEDGGIEPIEIGKKEVLPDGLRNDEWNPERYMAQHLYMGYDEPQEIQIKIRNTDYTILHDWFGCHYQKLHKKCEDGYDVVRVKTSPGMIVPWALQYADRVEILDSDIRERIREKIDKMNEIYREEEK